MKAYFNSNGRYLTKADDAVLDNGSQIYNATLTSDQDKAIPHIRYNIARGMVEIFDEEEKRLESIAIRQARYNESIDDRIHSAIKASFFEFGGNTFAMTNRDQHVWHTVHAFATPQAPFLVSTADHTTDVKITDGVGFYAAFCARSQQFIEYGNQAKMNIASAVLVADIDDKFNKFLAGIRNI